MEQSEVDKLWARAVAAEQREDWSKAKRLYRKVAKAFPRHAAIYQRLGLIALREARPASAVENFRHSLSIEPADPVCRNNLGNVLREQGKLREALSEYEIALELDPGYPSALYNLAGVLTLLGDHSRAADVYRVLLERRPGDAEAWHALGLALLESGEEAQAQEALEEALRLHPRDAEILNELGIVQQFEGNLEEAGRLYRASIDADPEFARGYDNLVRSRRMTNDDMSLVAPLEKIAADESRDEESRLIARFALGKIYDDCGDYDKAFENYAIGNALKHGTADFDAGAHSAWVDRVLNEFTEEFFRNNAGAGNPSERPVFVIGMIRSGTTLVEQILASHSRVFGAGELLEISRLVAALPDVLGKPEQYPECIRNLDARAIDGAAKEYLRALADRDDRALRVVDKLPTNFLYLGLIATLFPRARIVHCRRDPLDVCVSIYFQRFAQGHLYAYDLDDIAAYYADYERLMNHWRKVLPVEIHEVRYERLLDDLETEARSLLEFCGLEWEEGCLAFHRDARPVRTASSWQVRQPLYGTSRARWKNFEAHLDGLRNGLSARRERRA